MLLLKTLQCSIRMVLVTNRNTCDRLVLTSITMLVNLVLSLAHGTGLFLPLSYPAPETMVHHPPMDQRIVDQYFSLSSSRSTKPVSWLYGMIATYGIRPEQLKQGWTWIEDSILLSNKKRPIAPVHPQWVSLFALKEKQPCTMQSCLSDLCLNLYKLMAYQSIDTNVTDLVLAHRLRKGYYRPTRQPVSASRSFATAS